MFSENNYLWSRGYSIMFSHICSIYDTAAAKLFVTASIHKHTQQIYILYICISVCA